MKSIVMFAAAATLITTGSDVLQAQRSRSYDSSPRRGAFEFGIDAGIERIKIDDEGPGDNDRTLTVFSLPIQHLRVGLYLGDRFSLEPRLGVTRISEDDDKQLELRTTIAALFHFSENRGGGISPFLLVASGYDYVKTETATIDDSRTQARIGVGGGFISNLYDRLALRGSVEYHKSLESGDIPGASRLFFMLGLSFFAR